MPDPIKSEAILERVALFIKSVISSYTPKELDDLIAYLDGRPELRVVQDIAKEVRGGPWAELAKLVQ